MRSCEKSGSRNGGVPGSSSLSRAIIRIGTVIQTGQAIDTLAVLRRDITHATRKFGDLITRPTHVDPLGRGGVFAEANTGAPLRDRAKWTRRKPAAAIRTDIEEHGFYTVGAEGALIAADASVGRVGRQVLIAALAIGPQL